MAFCNSLEEVRKFFSKDKFATDAAMIVEEYGDKYAKCSFEIQPIHKNAMGSVMGGAIFTLADFAFAVAANWENPGTVSLNSNISFNGVAKGSRVIATAFCLKDGNSTCCYNIEVKDDLDNLVATVIINGFKKKVAK